MKLTLLVAFLFTNSLSIFAEEIPAPIPAPPVVTEATKETTPEAPPKEAITPFIKSSVGLGLRNTQWSHIEAADNTNMTFNIQTSTYTIVSADFLVPRWATKIGFNLNQNVGSSAQKAKQFAGYLGIARITLKTENGKFAGHAHYAGTIIPTQHRDVDFDQTYSYYELDFSLSQTMPIYLGLRKTKWKLPTEIALLNQGKTSGPTVFDEDFETSFTSLLFGIDSFKNFAISTNEFSPGFGVMALFELGMGLGNSTIGARAAQASKTIYNKTMTETDPGVMVLHTTGQLGPKYNFKIGQGEFSLGVGYDWNLLMLINRSQKSESSTTTSPVAYPNFVYHGAIIRFNGVI